MLKGDPRDLDNPGIPRPGGSRGSEAFSLVSLSLGSKRPEGGRSSAGEGMQLGLRRKSVACVRPRCERRGWLLGLLELEQVISVIKFEGGLTEKGQGGA